MVSPLGSRGAGIEFTTDYLLPLLLVCSMEPLLLKVTPLAVLAGGGVMLPPPSTAARTGPSPNRSSSDCAPGPHPVSMAAMAWKRVQCANV